MTLGPVTTQQQFPLPDPNEEAPRLFKMSAGTFELFCLDIARQSLPDVENADLYESSGLPQFGADFYVDCGGSGFVVGSCKAHEKPRKKDIVGDEGAQKFIDNWEAHWRPLGVTKFILCLGADVRDRTRLSHIQSVKNNIRALGIECEVWAQKELVDRCRNQEGIVRQYLGAAWVYRLCAYLQPFASEKEQNLVQRLYAETDDLRSNQTPLLNESLQNLQRLMRQDRHDEAGHLAAELAANHSLWRTAEPRQKARILRIRAGCIVETDIDAARALYASAATEDPPSDRYFDAIVTLRSAGNEAARTLLANPRTARERRLVAALLLEDGQAGEALAILNSGYATSARCDATDQADAQRLRAIACLMVGDAHQAVVSANAAVDLDGDLLAAHMIRAVAYYAASLSPAVGLPGMVWPTPYPAAFVRAGEEAAHNRAIAISSLERLSSTSNDPKRRAALGVWKFADLLDRFDKREEASLILDASYQEGDFHPGLVMWALARRLKFNKTKARRALEKMSSTGSPTSDVIAALLGLYADLKRYEEAQTLLEANVQLLSVYGESSLQMWREELSKGRASRKPANNISPSTPEVLQKRLSLSEVAAVLSDSSRSSLDRFEAASILAERSSWEPILDSSDFLLNEIATSHSFRLVAMAYAQLRSASEALAFLDDRAAEFCGKAIPRELAGIRLQLRARTGDITGALNEAQRLLRDPSDENYLLRAHLEAQAGDFVAAGRVVADAVGAGNSELNDPKELIRWATILRDDDPKRAATLLRRAKELGLQDTAGQAATLALSLIPQEAGPYVQAMHDAAGAAQGSVQLLTLDEVREMMREHLRQAQQRQKIYSDGDVPGHLVFGTKLGLAYLAPLVEPGQHVAQSVHIAHANGASPQLLTPTRILLDITAILVAEGLDLWPTICSAPFDFILPHDWSTAMLAMEQAALPGQPDRAKANEAVAELAEDGRLRIVPQRPAHSTAIALDDDGDPTDWCVRRTISALKGESAADLDLLKGKTVYLQDGVAEQLQLAGLLKRLCQVARVCFDEDAHRIVKEQRDIETIGALVGKRLRALRQTLSEYIRSQRIHVAPLVTLPNELMNRANPVETTLWSVLQQRGTEGLALWVDDRFVNGHSAINELPIVGIRTVLALLLDSGAITSSQRDDFVRKLRSSRHTFLPPSSDEIVQVLKAWTRDPALTKELEVLEGAVAILVAQHQAVLDKRDGPGILEHRAVFDQYFLARAVFGAVLADRTVQGSELQRACIWIFDKLRFDWRMGFNASNGVQASESIFVGWALVLFLAAFDVELLSNAEGCDRVQLAINTIFQERMSHAFETAPEQLRSMQEKLTETLASFQADCDDEQRPTIRALIGRYVDCLPELIQEALFANDSFASTLGVTKGVKVGELLIPNEHFWTAVAALETKSEVPVQPTRGEPLMLSRQADGSLLFEGPDESFLLGFPAPLIFHWDKTEREKGYLAISTEMQMASHEHVEFTDRLEAIEDFAIRERALDKMIKGTVGGRLSSLSRLTPGGRITAEQIAPPPAKALAEWLGLQDGQMSREDGVRELSGSFGEKEAAIRWMGIPLAPVGPVREWFANLSVGEATGVCEEIQRRCTTVVARRNLFELLQARDDLIAQKAALRDQILDGIPASSQIVLDFAYGSLAQLLAKGCETSPDSHVFYASWAWSQLLHTALGGGRGDLSGIARFFRNESKSGRRGLVQLLRFDDILNPMRLSKEQVAAGIAGVVVRAGGEPLSDHMRTSLAAGLTIQPGGTLPAVALFGTAGIPNPSDSWLGESATWMLDFLRCEDKFVQRALAEPAAVVAEESAKRFPDLTVFAALGTRLLAEQDLGRVFRFVTRQAPRFSRDDVVLAAGILSRGSCSSEALRSARQRAFMALSRRLPVMGVGKDAENAAISLAELGLVPLVREGGDWPGQVQSFMRSLARCWVKHFHNELLELIAVIAETVPVNARAPFWQLHTELRVAATGEPARA